ncbi:MAG: ABC transporter ATP-binding protein [Tissierellia bacterium]|nr:ABC transporter ATP-binding protein [Tissierellia bacterium]
MKKILKNHKLLWFFTFLSGVGITILNVGIAYVIGRIIDTISTQDMDRLQQVGIYAIVLFLGYIAVGTLYSYLASKFDEAVLKDTKSSVLRYLTKAPIDEYQKKDVSYYYNVLTQDMDQILTNYVQKTYGTAIAMGGLIVSLGALLRINIKMTLIFIGLLLFVTLVPRLFVGMQSKAASNFSEKYEHYVKELENLLSGFESIKLLNITKALYHKMTRQDGSMEEARQHKAVVDGFSLYSITGASFFMQIGCMFVGAYFAIRGEITTGMLLMAVQLLNFVFPPIREISTNRNLMKANEVIRDKVAPYLESIEETGRDMEPGAIQLKDYSLQFGDKKVLDHLNLKFEPNHSYVIIGPSGCGKSTLAKSIAGYFKDYDGQMIYGNREGKELKPSQRQEYIRYIGANPFVLNDNIKENIRLYREVPDEEVKRVAKEVGFDENFIEKESLGHGGKFISSGEYQRINIARALLDKPYCLIFDEPTANLDPENTKAIQKLIAEIELPIKIVITHDYTDEYLNSFDEIIDFNQMR